ncbi:MAG TPA: carboxypeptidase-like regulatory domain-containing protein [Candidatus Saccharimonadales bacterium]|nr:carboxypeptidase-like regulatory domain-containing protein [Candidatus Saccharimonadales bacterium]
MAENENQPQPIEINNQAPAEVPVDAPPETEKLPAGRWEKYKTWYLDRKKWTIPASVLILILLLAVIPFSRYELVGLVHKRNLDVRVIDATAGTPVSGATVNVGKISAETSATGLATLHNVKVGNQKLTISKKYYQVTIYKTLAPIFKQKTVPDIKLTATGRQVRISVNNLINKQPLSNVDIKFADISATTDQSGSATVVLPAGASQQTATLSRNGYNDAQVTVKVSNDKIQQDNFTLTPAGKVYFLSKLSGKIDVVKTNLDGTNRQTVLAGTGNEDSNNTVLLASRDWKYLALLSRRAGSSPSLYLIDTSDDSLITIDSGTANFSVTGWVDDNFVYTATRSDIQLWQSGRQAIKSYNAQTKKLTVLDQTSASGSDNFDYVAELVGDAYAYNGTVYYIMNWSGGINATASVSAKQATFNSVKPDGSAKKAIKSFALASGTTAIDVTLEERVESPAKVDLKFSDGNKDNFYVYTNGQVQAAPNLNTNSFYDSAYPTYLESPSGNNTFWSEPRDGKNTLFVGDEDGQNGKQVATLSDYNSYGWFTDNYLLVSKDASELYIMPKDGSQPAVKISDYHKPALNFPGYGGGYGGF